MNDGLFKEIMKIKAVSENMRKAYNQSQEHGGNGAFYRGIMAHYNVDIEESADKIKKILGYGGYNSNGI